jgi:hypothetical protein
MNNVTNLAQRRHDMLSELRKAREDLLPIIDNLRAGGIATDELDRTIEAFDVKIRELEPPA